MSNTSVVISEFKTKLEAKKFLNQQGYTVRFAEDRGFGFREYFCLPGFRINGYGIPLSKHATLKEFNKLWCVAEFPGSL